MPGSVVVVPETRQLVVMREGKAVRVFNRFVPGSAPGSTGAGMLLHIPLVEQLVWAERGLQYAPIAALSAVVLPEVVMTQGQLITTWQDARLFAAVAGAAYFFVRMGQGQAVLGTIVSGMVVYLPLHIGLGW